MTTYEHAMLGITGTLAAGLDRRYQWRIVALAAVASVLPDWDSLSLLAGAEAFDRIHRTLGHNLPVCVLVGVVFGVLDHRFGLLPCAARLLGKLFPVRDLQLTRPEAENRNLGDLAVWITVAVLASLAHLGGDLVFSGHPVLPEWGIRLFWPLSDRFFAYPMVPWGDPGVTIVFVAAMFAMLRWRQHRQAIAAATLLLAGGYVAARGWIFVW